MEVRGNSETKDLTWSDDLEIQFKHRILEDLGNFESIGILNSSRTLKLGILESAGTHESIGIPENSRIRTR